MRFLLKITKGATRRVLTGKTGPRCYYKGKRCAPAGFNTKDANYLVDRNRLHQFVVPDLTDFPLKPYVDATSLPDDMRDEDFPKGKLSSKMFIQLATKLGNEFNSAVAQPYNWLPNPPADVLQAIETNKAVGFPHHKAKPKEPHGQCKKIPNREFMPYRAHN